MTGTIHDRIAADLRVAITGGTLAEGERIPTEDELREHYSASRHSVRHALADLRAEGLLDNPHGRKGGTRVARRPVLLPVSRYSSVTDPDRPRPDLGPWETALHDAGITGHIEVLGVEREEAGAALAARLGVPAGTEVIRRDRLMHAAGRVAGLQTAWMPAALADGTPLAGDAKIAGGVYAELVRQGRPPVHIGEDVRARLATAEEREALGLPAAGIVLEVWRTTHGRDDAPLEVLRVVLDASAVRLTYDRLPL